MKWKPPYYANHSQQEKDYSNEKQNSWFYKSLLEMIIHTMLRKFSSFLKTLNKNKNRTLQKIQVNTYSYHVFVKLRMNITTPKSNLHSKSSKGRDFNDHSTPILSSCFFRPIKLIVHFLMHTCVIWLYKAWENDPWISFHFE